MKITAFDERAVRAGPRTVWMSMLAEFTALRDPHGATSRALGLDPAIANILDSICAMAVLAKRHPEYLAALFHDMPAPVEQEYAEFVDRLVNAVPIAIGDPVSTEEERSD